MRIFQLIIILYSLPLWAQSISRSDEYVDSFEYIDTTYGFWLNLPEVGKATHIWDYYTYETLSFKFSVYTHKRFLFFKHHVSDVDKSDTLLSLAKHEAYDYDYHNLSGGERYFRTDSLFEWNKYEGIRIIEFQRTEVFKLRSDPAIYEKVGPLYVVELNTSKGIIILIFNFRKYSSKYDIPYCRKIVSSINLL
ncbi:hypothetical protein ACFLTH_03675 [Bacteroidota bacterium]